MAGRVSISQQIVAAETALAWLNKMGAPFIAKTIGARPAESAYVLDVLPNVVKTLEWAAENREAFEAWRAETAKRDGAS